MTPPSGVGFASEYEISRSQISAFGFPFRTLSRCIVPEATPALLPSASTLIPIASQYSATVMPPIVPQHWGKSSPKMRVA